MIETRKIKSKEIYIILALNDWNKIVQNIVGISSFVRVQYNSKFKWVFISYNIYYITQI